MTHVTVALIRAEELTSASYKGIIDERIICDVLLLHVADDVDVHVSETHGGPQNVDRLTLDPKDFFDIATTTLPMACTSLMITVATDQLEGDRSGVA